MYWMRRNDTTGDQRPRPWHEHCKRPSTQLHIFPFSGVSNFQGTGEKENRYSRFKGRVLDAVHRPKIINHGITSRPTTTTKVTPYFAVTSTARFNVEILLRRVDYNRKQFYLR